MNKLNTISFTGVLLAFLITTHCGIENAFAIQEADSKAEETDKELLGEARSIKLQNDTGETEDHLNVSGAIYTMEFETPKQVKAFVWQVQIYASQFGSRHDSEAVNGDVYILDEDRKIISRTSFPYSLATQEKEWISIPTLPTEVEGKFYVSINTHGGRFKGFYMGYVDGNKEGKASTDAIDKEKIVSQKWSKKFSDKQWLIRADIADRPIVYRAKK